MGPPPPLPPLSSLHPIGGVGAGAGQVSVIPLPSAARSAAAVLAHAHKPTRAVLDRARPGMGWTTEYDEMQQIRPQPSARMWGRAARTSRTALSRLASTAARMASSSTSSERPGGGPPALATTMSSRPKRSTVAARAVGYLGVGHVGHDPEDVGPGGLQLLLGPVEGFGPPGRHHHLGPFGRQGLGAGPAQARATTP